MPHTCITAEVKSTLEGVLSKCESISLRYTKLVKVPRSGEQDEKQREIQSIVDAFKRKNICLTPNDVFLPPKTKQFALRLGGNLIVNQATGILENTGICLHRFRDYPYIPGSALKGIARHYAWEKWSMETDENQKEKLAEDIAETFGFPTGDKSPSDSSESYSSNRDYLDDYLWQKNPNKYGRKSSSKTYKGTVAFLDAIPEPGEKIQLAVDICTCHHPKYYNPNLGKTIPFALDNEDPNPQTFPVVAQGYAFNFRLVPLVPTANLSFAEKLLREALVANGVGGKTTAGYGWFKEDSDLSNKYDTEASSDPKLNALVKKIQKLSSGKIKDFLKNPELSEMEQEAFKIAIQRGLKGMDELRTQYKRGKAISKILARIFKESADAIFAG